MYIFFFKQKTAYEMRISDWSSDVCSSDLRRRVRDSIARFTRDARATVLIEMAFAIPFLVLVGFGGLEIANLTLTQTRISQIGLNAADNASRIAAGSNLAQPQVRETDINEVFAGVEKIGRAHF